MTFPDLGLTSAQAVRPAADGADSRSLDPDHASAALGATLMRVSLGIVYLAHGPLLKGMVFGLPGVSGYFTSLGLPGALAYVVFAMETLGGIMLVLGIRPGLAALALLPVLFGAILFDHGANGWLFSMPGGGWEYPVFLIVASVAVWLTRGGAYCLKP
ncbi:MAG: DoxX family protein [Pseudomonadota bacterium]